MNKKTDNAPTGQLALTGPQEANLADIEKCLRVGATVPSPGISWLCRLVRALATLAPHEYPFPKEAEVCDPSSYRVYPVVFAGHAALEVETTIPAGQATALFAANHTSRPVEAVALVRPYFRLLTPGSGLLQRLQTARWGLQYNKDWILENQPVGGCLEGANGRGLTPALFSLASVLPSLTYTFLPAGSGFDPTSGPPPMEAQGRTPPSCWAMALLNEDIFCLRLALEAPAPQPLRIRMGFAAGLYTTQPA